MNLKNELATNGFATIDYPEHLTLLVMDMMRSWKKFCDLPLETKSRFIYTGDSGTGYEFKNEEGVTKDRKENFHFTLQEMKRIADISNDAGVNPVFASDAYALLEGIRDPLYSFARSLEIRFNLIELESEIRQSKPMWFLRLLHYPAGSEPGQVIAAHHPDKLGLTMYLGETTPGVQYYSQDRKWEDMPVLAGKTIITPNMQMQYRSRGRLTALYHRVVANEICQTEGRYSIVCFIGFPQTPQYDKACHGRLQDQPLAFNYGQPYREFRKLFV